MKVYIRLGVIDHEGVEVLDVWLTEKEALTEGGDCKYSCPCCKGRHKHTHPTTNCNCGHDDHQVEGYGVQGDYQQTCRSVP